jgi:hypothetical protein
VCYLAPGDKVFLYLGAVEIIPASGGDHDSTNDCKHNHLRLQVGGCMNCCDEELDRT